MDKRRTSVAIAVIGLIVAGYFYPYFHATLDSAGIGHAPLLAAFSGVAVSIASLLLGARIVDGNGRRLGALLVSLVLVAAVLSGGHLGVLLDVSNASLLLNAYLLAVVLWALGVCWRAMLERRRSGARAEAATLWAAVAVGSIFVALFVVWYAMSRFVWFWDFSGYANISSMLVANGNSNGVGAMLAQVWHSLSDEYNQTPALPLALTEMLMGSADRVVLIMSITVFYVAPTVLLMAYALHRFSGRQGSGRLALLVAVLSLLVFPVVFFSPLYGMPDIGGVAIIALIACTANDESRSERETLASLILCGVMIVLLCVFRRWYVFIAVPLVALKCAIELHRARQGKGIRLAILSLLVFGGAMALAGFGIYWQRVLVMLQGDYSEAYAAYGGTLSSEWHKALTNFGCLPLAMSLAALLLLFLRRSTRLLALALVFLLVVTTALFLHVQGFGRHHYLLVVPLLCFAVGLVVLKLHARNIRQGRMALIGIGVVAIVSVLGVLSPKVVQPHRHAPATSKVDMRPPYRSDMPELSRLVTDLERYAAGGSTVCVAASGVQLNQSIVLEHANALGGKAVGPLMSHFVGMGDVDRRDGPATHFPDCRYVVVTDPVETHLDVSEQQVIAYLASSIIQGKGLGRSYRPTGDEYPLENGRRAFIVERVQPIDPADWAQYLDAVTKK